MYMSLCFHALCFIKICFLRKSVGSKVPHASGKPSAHKADICQVDDQVRNECQTRAIKTEEYH